MLQRKHLILAGCCWLAVWSSQVRAFNLSPWPTIELRPPSNGERSAYFGLTINLRSKSILIGAPRSNSSLPAQNNIPEPGTIYRAALNDTSLRDPPCNPFNFELSGNKDATNQDQNHDGELRDFQWLGASMDGGPSESQPIAVCAPRMHAHDASEGDQRELNPGICYWTPNSTDTQPAESRSINVLNRRDQQELDGIYNHQLGELGFSMHVIPSNNSAPEILIGAPGVMNWRGSVVLYRPLDKSLGSSSRRRRRDMHRHMHSILLDPVEAMQVEEGAYFGYAVTSAPHFPLPESKDGLAYLASAPRQGVVYTFGLRKRRIFPYASVTGDRLGEYFGYSLAVDDFDGDGRSDLAVGAPLYSREGGEPFDSGAVYVYSGVPVAGSGSGQWQFRRRLHAPQSAGSGRFGTTLALLGDLNGDGLGDLSVGAPFEADGVVYIYLGSRDSAIRAQYSQRLEASPRGVAWFGHGLSRGVDVDGNGWRDLAVGAPNADIVYVYQSYPVVVLEVWFEPSAPAIEIDAKELEFKLCWRAQRKDVRLVIDVELDKKCNRVENSTIRLIVDATAANKCKAFKRDVTFKQEYAYDQIALSAHFAISNESLVKEAEHRVRRTFCSDCVAVDPHALTKNTSNVIFNINCKQEKCVADLQVSSSVLDHSGNFTFVVGSKTSLAINYLIRNDGENAFQPHLYVKIPDNIFFAVIPANCVLETKPVQQLNCELSGDRAKSPLGPNETTLQTIHLDTAKLVETGLRNETRALILEALTVYGPETDRQLSEPQKMRIALAENSVVQVAGISSVADVSLEDGLRVLSIVHPLKVSNSGPSRLHEVEIEVLVPLIYRRDEIRLQVLDWQQIEINCTFKGTRIPPVWYFNNTRLLPGQRIPSTETSPIRPIVAPKLYTLDDLGLQLPPSRTILFNCHNESVQCAQVRFAVRDFRVGDQPVAIEMQMQLDLAIINEIVDDIRDTFVLQTLARVRRHKEEHFGNRTVQVEAKFPFTEIRKYKRQSLIWVYVLSALGGLAILVGMTYGMHRAGFFQRAQRAQMEQQRDDYKSLQQQDTGEQGLPDTANSSCEADSEVDEDEAQPIHV